MNSKNSLYIMINFIKKIIKKPVKKIFEWTEKTSAAAGYKVAPKIFTKDIYIPIEIIAIFIYISLLTTLSFDLDLSLSGVFGLMVFLAIVMFFSVILIKRTYKEFTSDDEGVMLTGFIIIFIVFLSGALKIYGIPVWAVPTSMTAILITLLISPVVAGVASLIVSIFLGILFDFSITIFLFSFLGNIISIYFATKVKNRQDIVKIGYYIILMNIVFIGSFSFIENWESDMVLPSVLWSAVNGISSVMLVSAFLPYLERFFSKTTSIRLLELSDFNQPLLKRMKFETPGSFHHALMVASLSEAAAEVVGAHPLLCRVGAYYHDVGKIVTPEYFIENQSDASSKHDDLKSQMSSFVVISHVKEGVRLAKEYGLDKIVIDIIQQHHGTSLVHYFYMKAIENGQTEPEKSVYRYPGPRPKTKESAIVMLADSVEAASRTLEEPSYTHLQEMVYKIINNKFIDDQLTEVELTLADLHKIAEKFVNILAGIFHSRVEYPEEKEAEKERKEEKSTDADKNLQ